MYNEMSIMMIPNGFKIRKKADVKTFMEECMCKGSSYGLVIRKDFAVRFEKDKEGNICIMTKHGDLKDIFNPLLTVADTKNNIYEHDVNYYIWHYRKYINAKWFNDKE
jgi:hypothetical protein